MQQKTLKRNNDKHHVLTVRLLKEDFKHLQRAQDFAMRVERKKITFTDLIRDKIRELPTSGR